MPKSIQLDEAKFTQAHSPAYQQLVADVSTRVQTGRLVAYRAANKELIQMYWDLGKMILERQEENGWGNSVVEMLAKDLQKAFPKMEGISKTNLWRMRAFYRAYEQEQFLPPAVGEIGWTHNYLIIEKCKDPNERLFYIHQTKRYGWTNTYSICKTLPQELSAFFPSAEELIKRVEAVMVAVGA